MRRRCRNRVHPCLAAVLSVCNESMVFSLENAESLLEFPTISRRLRCVFADSLQTERTPRNPRL